jgi:ABC-type multidrug transport system fused ATPase/permease subunit
MGLPPNARRYFAEKHLDAAYKHLSAIEDNLFKENQEDRRSFEKFYNNLALFSGGTVALSITYLGYLKTLGKPLHHQRLLTASWIALFACLLFSLVYVLVTLYYSHHFREREWAEARKKKFETEAEEVPSMGVENVQTPQEVAAFQRPRREAVQICTEVAEKHEKLQNRYQTVWVWSGRLAQLAFAAGIGMLLVFAISNT